MCPLSVKIVTNLVNYNDFGKDCSMRAPRGERDAAHELTQCKQTYSN